LRADKVATAETTAFVSHKNKKKWWNSTKVNSSKYKKRGADHAKQNFPSNKWPAESSQKQQHTRDRVGKSAAKKNADAFQLHVMGLQEQTIYKRTAGTLIAVRHGTLRLKKHYFVVHKINQF
jgi:hypothetical protein